MLEFHNFNDLSMDSNIEPPMHFDAIILDLNMPIMDGYEACK